MKARSIPRRAFKYRLFTNANQERELGAALESHRRLYNECLDLRKMAWETLGASIGYCDCSRWFRGQRATNPYFAPQKSIPPRPWYPPQGAHEVLHTHWHGEHEVTARYWLSPDHEDLLRVELVSVDLQKPGPEHAGILEALSDQWGACPFEAVKDGSWGY